MDSARRDFFISPEHCASAHDTRFAENCAYCFLIALGLSEASLHLTPPNITHKNRIKTVPGYIDRCFRRIKVVMRTPRSLYLHHMYVSNPNFARNAALRAKFLFTPRRYTTPTVRFSEIVFGDSALCVRRLGHIATAAKFAGRTNYYARCHFYRDRSV